MTELTITFDGRDLTLSSNGNEIARFDAYSGHGAYQAPQFQNYANHGPIPEGSYSFTLNDIQQPSAIDIFLSPFGMGAWPAWGGSEVGWGTIRAPLTPSEGTETYGRSGFFIHGGQNPGSAGCIDVTTNDIALFSFIKVYEDSDGIIPVIVSYSPPIQSNSLDAAINAAHPFYEDAIVRMAGGGSGRGSDDDDSGSGAGATGGGAITTGNELSVDAGIVAPVANPPGTWSGGGTGTPDPGLPINPDYVGIQPIILDLDGDGVEVNAAANVDFDWDGDGFLESGNWAACNGNAEPGLWRVAIGMKRKEKSQLIMAQPEPKCCKQELPSLRMAVFGLLTWAAILLQPLAAQAQECVTQSRFLASEFDSQAAPCENLKPYQLAYCNRQELTGRDSATLAATADFAEFLVPIWPEQAEAAITLADSGRLAALQDDTLPSGYSALFYLLYTRLLAALISEAQPSLNQDKLFAYREVEVEFFPYHMRGGASFFRRALQCTVRCGSEAIDAQQLTRSPIFLNCVE